LAVVAKFLARLERAHIGRGNDFRQIAQAFERSVHQPLVLPREAAEKQRGAAALIFAEEVLSRLLEVVYVLTDHTCFALEPCPFLCQPLLNDLLNRLVDRASYLH